MNLSPPYSPHRGRIRILTVAHALLAASAGSTLLAQSSGNELGSKTWNFTYDGGAGADFGESIKFDSVGRIIVAGRVATATQAENALVFQVTPGEPAVNWAETRDITGTVRNDRFYSMMIDGMDNAICVGVAASPSRPYSQGLIEKFKPDGTTAWQDVWDAWPSERGTEAFYNDVALNSDNEAFVATYFDIGAHNYINWGVRKYTASGTATLESDYTYDRGSPTGSYTYSNRIQAIALDNAGGLCTAGTVGEGSNARRSWHVRRYDEIGDLAWSDTRPAPGNGLTSWAQRVAIDPDGNPVVVGRVQPTAGVWEGLVVKYDNESGDALWSVEFPGSNSALYTAVLIDRMGYYWVGGWESDAENTWITRLFRLNPDDGSVLSELVVEGFHLRDFDVRSRRLALLLSDSEDILVEVYTPDLPEISLQGDLTVDLEVHSEFVDPGYSAYDAFEREDLTSAVVVSVPPDIHTVGTYTLHYNAEAYNGEAAEEKVRTVNIIDTTPPEITLLGGEEIRVDAGVPYLDPGFEVADNYDQNLAASIEVIGPLDTSTPGSYELTYMVTDSSGNPATAVTRRVHVVELAIATIEITPGGELRITAETQAGASYRVMVSSNLQDWEELAVVPTPTGQLEWLGELTGETGFVRLERIAD